MCGIVGIATQRKDIDLNRLVQMRDTLLHRGPDDADAWLSAERTVGLGHRRLSILDLSEAGRQPMVSACGRFRIVLNGEIYNYRELRGQLAGKGHGFRSQTDTEVLLNAYAEWGEGCLEFLNGMFAFALYDAERHRIFMARDRAGEKPLFFSHRNGALAFASELKALLAQPGRPRTIDLEALDHYLAFGYVAGGRCLISGVQKLPPAHSLTYDIGRDELHCRRYWSLPDPCSEERGGIDALADELEQLLGDAVLRQLVADVPIGVLLSGGVDSSVVTALAARHSSAPVRTFTIVFPEHPEYDEGPSARIVAGHFGTDHTELVAEPATVDLLPALARQYDEPIADSSMIPTYLVSRLVRKHCTVALGGDGGDELFGGYKLYTVVQAQQQFRSWLPGPVRNLIGAAAKRLPVGVRGRSYAINLPASPLEAVASTGIYLDRATRERLVPALKSVSGSRAEQYRLDAASRGRSHLQRLTIADFHSYLPDDILVKVDRASMLASLETRAPFLDRGVIEFAYGRVPDRFRATLWQRKVLLRHLARRLLPPQLDLKRKQGFSIPLAAWIKGPWGARMSEILAGMMPGLFDAGAVAELFALQRKGLSNSQRLYALTMLELWRREYDVGLPG
jgi:asparagine synthase (glutamine-hydrolysing)